jgi:lysophospholipase L1-like esterase
MVNLCQGNGIRPIILTSPIPSLETYYGTGKVSPMHQYHGYYNDKARQLAADYNVDLVDLAIIFDNYNDLFDDVQLDPIHFNAKGNRVAAEAIYQYLANNQLIK